jgi:hypothetical protein
MNFWDFIGLMFWSYVIISFLGILLGLMVDIFRDQKLNGWVKAAWIVFLVFVPILGAIVYVITRGRGMSERQFTAAQQAKAQTDSYIRSVATVSPSDEIAKAKALLDSGSISQSDFDRLKTRALEGSSRQFA